MVGRNLFGFRLPPGAWVPSPGLRRPGASLCPGTPPGLRQLKYLNNIVEHHRRIKRLIRPGLGFGGFWTARRTLAGIEAMAMMRKGQVRNIRGNDVRAQANFIAGLFQMAA
jgi:transposase-like protein